MKETIDLLGKIITNILTALYEPFGFSLLLSFLAMFFYLYAYEPIHAGKKKYFDKLLSLSQVGLVANPAQTETAEFALMKLKDEIVLVEGKRIKNHYMKYLGIDALIIGAIASIVLGICFYFTRWIGCISVLCIIIGALTGTWVSFGARKFEIEFEDLASLEKDKMTPVIRLIYIAVIFFLYFEQFLDFRFTRRPYCLFIIVCYRSAVGASIRQFLSREAVAAGIAKVVVQVIFTPISNISLNAIMVGSSLPVSFINPV